MFFCLIVSYCGSVFLFLFSSWSIIVSRVLYKKWYIIRLLFSYERALIGDYICKMALIFLSDRIDFMLYQYEKIVKSKV